MREPTAHESHVNNERRRMASALYSALSQISTYRCLFCRGEGIHTPDGELIMTTACGCASIMRGMAADAMRRDGERNVALYEYERARREEVAP